MFDLCTASASSISFHIRSPSVQSVRHSATTTHLRAKGVQRAWSAAEPQSRAAGRGGSRGRRVGSGKTSAGDGGERERGGARMCFASAIWKK